ncbi:hypothetical protein BU17DRAFT_67098 [Hysterangium stoloniferum]|nr:hypothetical protein BU17DRAFT_67098 [Hysterangium stoloniferum]
MSNPPQPPPPPPVGGGYKKSVPTPVPPVIAVGSSKNIKLTHLFPGASRVFEGTDGITPVIAKENPSSAEITNTQAASKALESGLFISTGTFGGENWLILRKFTGQDFGTIGRAAGGFDEATCRAKLDKAITLAATAQAKLAAGAKFIQGDTSQENYLFDKNFTCVDMIDFGVTSKAIGDVLAGQKKALAADTFTIANMKMLGVKSAGGARAESGNLLEPRLYQISFLQIQTIGSSNDVKYSPVNMAEMG